MNRVQGLVRRKWCDADGEGWQDLRLHLFDLPRHYVEPFPEVYNRMMALGLPAHCSVIPQRLAKSAEDVQQEFQRVLDRGGEGLCLRETSGTYHLTKLKPGTVERRLLRCFRVSG